MQGSTQLERRRLNDEIEETFLNAAKAASNAELKIVFKKGSLLGDLQDFHQHFSYLVRLTINLREMGGALKIESNGVEIDLAKIKKNVLIWKNRQIPQNAQDSEVEFYIKDGLKIFDEYYKCLMHVGIITLPTKKG